VIRSEGNERYLAASVLTGQMGAVNSRLTAASRTGSGRPPGLPVTAFGQWVPAFRDHGAGRRGNAAVGGGKKRA
jgi:hypothetical protein